MKRSSEEESQEGLRKRMEQIDPFSIGSPFPHPAVEPSLLPRGLDERLIIEISWKIRSMKDWKLKYKDEKTGAIMKKEIHEEFKKRTKFIDQVIDFVFSELKWYEDLESRFLKSSKFHIGINDYVSISHNAIVSPVKQILKDEVKLLDNPEIEKTEIDLVDPCLFPIRYDSTPIINRDNRIEIVKFHERIERAKGYLQQGKVSKKFQCIPTLMKQGNDGNFTFSSYINNLYPLKHKDLYSALESIFNAAIPGLNYVLTRYASKEHVRIEIPLQDEAFDEEYLDEAEEHYMSFEMFEDTDSENGEASDEYREFIKSINKHAKDFPPKWTDPPEFDKIIDVKSYKELKVIVKLKNIELTPKNSSYDDYPWQAEPAINEDVIATVIYFYDMDNISCNLPLRSSYYDQRFDSSYEFYVNYFFGVKDREMLIHEIGSTQAKEDDIMIFPNMYQHRVDKLELNDKTKPGHAKILFMFIVDPYNTNVVSSDRVPPQQEQWWNDSTLNYLIPESTKQDIMQLKSDQNWPMKLEEAEIARNELKRERDEAQGVFEYEWEIPDPKYMLC